MKCPKCEENIEIKIGTKLDSKDCKVLTSLISIVTVQCDKCKSVFQVPIISKDIIRIKKDKNDL